MKSIDEFIVPWVRQSEPYSARHMDFASENPHLIRMMSNENLLPPSQKVLEETDTGLYIRRKAQNKN